MTHWRVEATIDEVKAILGARPSLPPWWPLVYLGVEVIDVMKERSAALA